MKNKLIIITALIFTSLLCSLFFAVRAEDNGFNSNLTVDYDERTKTLTIVGEGIVYGREPEVDFTPEWYGYSSNVKKIVVGEGITEIGYHAFENMTNLRSVSLPDTLTDIGYYAFYGCTSLTEIKIPASVTSIGGQAFGGCKNLSKINLGDNLKTLSASAFNGCDKIDSVSVPSGVTNIYNIDECEKPVRVSEDNQTYSSVDGTLYDKNKTVLYKYNNSLTQKSFTVPDTVRTLAFMAFANSRLQRITLPEGLTTMEKGVFYCCEKLETITIPDSVTEISTFLF